VVLHHYPLGSFFDPHLPQPLGGQWEEIRIGNERRAHGLPPTAMTVNGTELSVAEQPWLRWLESPEMSALNGPPLTASRDPGKRAPQLALACEERYPARSQRFEIGDRCPRRSRKYR
jgi:hypothetical protein